MKEGKRAQGFRLGEFWEPLQARAKAEGVTQTEVLKRALAAYLEADEPKPPVYEPRSGPTFGNVRWGGLLDAMIERAVLERTTVSSIARRAARYFLTDQRVPQILAFKGELRQAHANMARVGGNLYRIARLLNTDNIFPETEIARTHDELLNIFKDLADLYSRVERKLDQQTP